MIKKDVEYKTKNIGYFKSLEPYIKNGFNWGVGIENMSYLYDSDQEAVKARIAKFLLDLNMNQESVTMFCEHSDRIVDIEDLVSLESLDFTGKYAQCDALFTTNDISLIAKPADCTVSIIYAFNGDIKITGLVHAGLKGMDLRLPTKSIDFLKGRYGIKPENIFIGIAPSISKDHYTKENLDELTNVKAWGPYMTKKEKYHFDLLGYLLNQYQEVDIPDKNIEAYEVDTYLSHEKGEGFSHRYSTVNELPNKRFIVAVQL